MNENLMDKVVSLAKRRGFVYPGSSIYGGLANAWDYGPLGVELKNNIKQAWWDRMVRRRPEVVGLDSGVVLNPKVWEASGHLKEFSDPLVDCKKCKNRYREDHLLENSGAKSLSDVKCPNCGAHEWTEARPFNLMFKTFIGPVEDEANTAYLRPETAQGIFINFKNVLDTTRLKLPFGIAQIGKSFRNEITPGNFIFRTREFEQMEMEYFVVPEDEPKYYKYWVEEREKWYLDLGIKKENLRTRAHSKTELAHYAKAAMDIEYQFPFGWSELEGIASRTDFDLKAHTSASGEKLVYKDDEGNSISPFVVEPAAGVDRALLAFLIDAYDEDEADGETRVVLRLHPKLAPIKAAILPLVKKEPVVNKAKEIFETLIAAGLAVEYDESGSIGKRYRRHDETGTPLCITVDFDGLEDDTVTVRDRDTMKQERVSTTQLLDLF